MRECDDVPRDEHLQWAKDRALPYLDRGDLSQAFTSMCSDLNKHSELADHIGLRLGMGQQMIGNGMDREALRRWIEGFN